MPEFPKVLSIVLSLKASEHKRSFYPLAMLIKSINATLQAQGLKVQLLLLRARCMELSPMSPWIPMHGSLQGKYVGLATDDA